MKIIVIGAAGQLGSDIIRVLDEAHDVIPFFRKSSSGEILDIEDYGKVEDKIEHHKPDVVINATAFHQVDLCETERERAFSVNSHSVKNLAGICGRKNIILVHISTDYVFDGRKGAAYDEGDIPNPINVYGESKLEGEDAVRKIPRHFVIRTSYLFGDAGRKEDKSNLIETLLKFGKGGEATVVFDNKISPTYTLDLARKISELLKTNEFGLYHLTNFGECSVHELAKEIFLVEGLSPKLNEVSHSEFNSPAFGKALRPLHSSLTSINLKNTGLSEMRHWKDALRDYLKENKMETPINSRDELRVNLDTNMKITPDGQRVRGVEVINRKTHSDDRGYLTEIYRVDEPYHEQYGGPLRQVYLVENDMPGIIRAFHKHKELWDFFSVSRGRAKFILIDDRPESETYGKMNVVVLNSRNKGLLIVPPGVFHGWMSLTNDTQLLSIASHTYNHENPDEVRVPPESFGAEWEVRGR